MVSNKPLKIGLIGGIRAGKDTVALILTNTLDNSLGHRETTILSFSNGIHEVIKAVMPHVYEQGKPRKELQHIGQGMRELDEDVWVNMLLNSSEYRYAEFEGDNIVITDVRQKNEAERLKAEGFILLKVVASKEVRLQRAKQVGDNFNPTQFNHETEVSVDSLPFDYMINNNGTFLDLNTQVKSVIASMYKGGNSDGL